MLSGAARAAHPSTSPGVSLCWTTAGCTRTRPSRSFLKDRHNTTVMIPGDLTPVIQPCDRMINKEFKRRLKALYMAGALDQTRDEANGKMSPSRGQVAAWVKEAWAALSPDVMRQCFKVCGLTLNLDGTRTTRGACIHSAATTANCSPISVECRKTSMVSSCHRSSFRTSLLQAMPPTSFLL